MELNNNQLQEIINNTDQSLLENIHSLVIFLGHAHSGHSIIGAIMDAHPDVSIANEVNITKLIRDHHLNKDQIEAVLYHFSQENLSNSAWHNTAYKYNIPNGFQGKTMRPLVIGDKKGGATTRIIMQNPNLLDYLIDLYGTSLKIINVHRNPIDIIAAYSHYWNQPIGMKHFDRFVENDQANIEIKQKVKNSQWLDIDQNKFICHPNDVIRKIFDYIGVSTNHQDVASWTSIVKSDIVGKSKQMKIPSEVINSLYNYLKKRIN